MYNSDIPTRAELPSSAQLIKSTIIAIITAAILLVTVVLPAEYAIDPTGIGRILKLSEMGEIKKQLAEEAARDRVIDGQPKSSLPATSPGIFARIGALIVSPAAAQTAAKSDETVITLKPTEGVEWKMTMAKGATADFTWSVLGGVVNYDMHGTPKGGGKETSYKAERGVSKSEGTLTAGFDGSHGWFFRNRGTAPVTITLKTKGAYTDLKRVQ